MLVDSPEGQLATTPPSTQVSTSTIEWSRWTLDCRECKHAQPINPKVVAMTEPTTLRLRFSTTTSSSVKGTASGSSSEDIAAMR